LQAIQHHPFQNASNVEHSPPNCGIGGTCRKHRPHGRS
jgi:hypothetical protein